MDDEDSQWTAMDDQQARFAAMGSRHPFSTAFAVITALTAPTLDVYTLSHLVTPESLAGWGDFSGLKGWFNSIPDKGIGSTVNRRDGAPDVGYFKILHNVTKPQNYTTPVAMLIPGVLTLVWRPEVGPQGMWLMHQAGEAAEPETLVHVRTSIGEAPDF